MTLRDDLTIIRDTAQRQLDALDVPPADAWFTIHAGGDLQRALEQYPRVRVADGTFTTPLVISEATSLVLAPGVAVKVERASALTIPPGTHDVAVNGGDWTSTAAEVIRIGANDNSQKTVESAPVAIVLTNVRIPQHRSKRGIAIHAQGVLLEDCEVLDCWDAAGQDSQAVYVGNAPGNIEIRGGHYQAGSEIILFGGDVTAIPDLTPAGVIVDTVTMDRPLSWQTDGTKRKVKNIFELKNARNVRLTDCVLDGCWADGQQGEAVVLTPALDGDRKDPPLRSGEVMDVLIERCTIRNCSSGFGMIGRQYTAYTVNRLDRVEVANCTIELSRARFGGRGQLATMGGEPGSVSFDGCAVVQDGTSLLYYSFGSVIDPVTKQLRAAGKMGALTLTNSRATLPVYGLNLGGSANAANWSAAVESLTVTGNVFTGNPTSAMKKALPDNQYLA